MDGVVIQQAAVHVSLGVLQVRYPKIARTCLCFRFIYVRHGSSLVKEGTKLLHLLSSVFVIIYIINRNFHAVRARAVADK